jgi:hypothetical protein
MRKGKDPDPDPDPYLWLTYLVRFPWLYEIVSGLSYTQDTQENVYLTFYSEIPVSTNYVQC